MSGTLFVATRKGLFRVTRARDGWRLGAPAFLGDPVSAVLPRRDGSVLAALDLGHFGVKLHVSTDGGATFRETGCPAFPVQTDGREGGRGGADEAVAVAGPEDLDARGEPRTAPCGPARSRPGSSARRTAARRGSLVRELWDRPERGEWFGGGYDHAGIHSIAPDPRRPARAPRRHLVRRRLGTEDGGATWAPAAKGMRAAYMPPEKAYDENVQDPHRVARCAASPDTLWAQHHNGVFRTDGRRAELDGDREGRPVDVRLRGRRAPGGSAHGVVRPGRQGREARPGRRPPRRHADARRRRDVRRPREGPAGARRVRPRLPPRPRRRRVRPDARVRVDDGQPLRVGGRGRLVDARVRAPAARVRGEIRLTRLRTRSARTGP